jgi:spermidine/putrescine transport system permease protein
VSVTSELELKGRAAPGAGAVPGGASQPPRRPLLRLGGRRRVGGALEHPLMSAPALAVVLLGIGLPLAILIAYTFFPTSAAGQVLTGHWVLSNYRHLFADGAYFHTLLVSFLFVSAAAGLTVVLTFPFAYYVAFRARPDRRLLWILVAVLPFGTSYLIRIFAWLNLFGDQGIINQGLTRTHLASAPVAFFGYGRPAILITFVYLLFPLAFLSSYIALERLDPAVSEAAADLGARPWQTLRRVILPLAKSGLYAGFAFSFIDMIGDYATPRLIGGSEGTFYANLMVNQFGLTSQWGFGAVLALTLLIAMALFFLAIRAAIGGTEAAGGYTRSFIPRRAPFLRAYAAFFTVLLYVPIALLMLFAFNTASFVGFPIRGLTFHWFDVVLGDGPLLSALQTSLEVAAVVLVVSLVLGSLAAVQLARARGRLRDTSIAAIGMPMLLPPLVLALGLIIMLNALGIQRGLWTIMLGHTLLILPLVTLLILVRLEGLDRNLELAAMDLGARPWQAFLRISVPQAIPGIIAAALIGFVFSMDEFILTFLVTGSQTTLPLYIYGALKFNITPELNALSSLILTGSLLLLVVGFVIASGRSRRRRRGAAPTLSQALGTE